MTIRELEPTEVWITHGREEALKHWCMTHQIKACELNLVGYEDEDV
jgi:putative mRNA 3-end processing factor